MFKLYGISSELKYFAANYAGDGMDFLEGLDFRSRVRFATVPRSLDSRGFRNSGARFVGFASNGPRASRK
jgi:hypothetical protein